MAALKREFADWRARSAPGEHLEKHHTQIQRITTRLEEFLDKEADIPVQGRASFGDLERSFTFILGAHRIWDFFRSKLALRDIALLQSALLCADELAWKCYSPARQLAGAAGTIPAAELKEPPLVYFSGEATPFVQSRNTPFVPEGITARDIRDFGLAILSLPIPVVGVPWFQFNHLPAAVVISHEVGHAVEHDFGIEPVVEQLITNLQLPDGRQDAWLAWRHEIFADVYAVLCTGPAYVLALMDYLVSSAQAIQQEMLTAANWGRYPTRFLRMELNFELLSQLGLLQPLHDTLATLGLQNSDLVGLWRNTYKFHLMEQYVEDLQAIVSVLLEGPYPVFGKITLPDGGQRDRKLHDVINFTPKNLESARKLAVDVNQGNALASGLPVGQLFPAATLAYYADPDSYNTKNANSALIEQIRRVIQPGVRSGDPGLADEQRQQLEVADREAGRKLAEFFEAAR
jgi:hypothetical protein